MAILSSLGALIMVLFPSIGCFCGVLLLGIATYSSLLNSRGLGDLYLGGMIPFSSS